MTASNNSDDELRKREQQQEIILLLLAHGARPTDEDSSGVSVRARAKAEWLQRLLDGRVHSFSRTPND